MNKTILVIGEVTRNQYQAARIELLRQGYKPRIMRVTAWDLKPDEDDLREKYGDGTLDTYQFMELDDDTSERLLEEYCRKHYEQYGDIAAIVVSDDVYSNHCSHGSFRARWYMGGYFDKTPLWRVHNGNYVELIS